MENVEKFIKEMKLDKPPIHHFHGLLDPKAALQDEWHCAVCGKSSLISSSGLKITSADLQHTPEHPGIYRVKDKYSPKICEHCDRKIHKLLGTCDGI